MNADIAAATALLGYDPTHPVHEQIKPTEGWWHCNHVLAGNGRDIDEIAATATVPMVGVETWRKAPYRHHDYTPRTPVVEAADWPPCHCGNYRDNPIHTHCWEDEPDDMPCDDCGRTDGTHDLLIEH